MKQLQVEHQRIPCIVMQSAARHPFEAQFLCARGAYAVTPKWNHKGIVEQIRQSAADWTPSRLPAIGDVHKTLG